MGDEDLNFIPNKELDKEDLIPIPRESKIGKECDFPLCDDFQSFKTFSNPLFEKKDDFPSRNDESILKEEVFRQISPKDNSEPSNESLPKDDFDNDDDLFEIDSNNDEWKRILYGEGFEIMDSVSAKTKNFDKSSSNVFKSLSDELEHHPRIKVFNPGILVDKNSKVHEPNVLPIRKTLLCPRRFSEIKDIKVKKSKNEQKPTRNEETSTRERFEANIESRIKTVVEKRQESKEKDKSLKEKDYYTL
ncbi:hypothetical protein Tco_0417869 [Tanacetum coccineum]